MAQERLQPFSCGTDFEAWSEHNCDHCVKASHLRESIAGEEYTTFRCAVQKEIILASIGDGLVSKRSYDICQHWDCPNRQETRKKYHKRDNSPSLF